MAKGWTKKNHKYLRIENGRYIYPDDMPSSDRRSSQSQMIKNRNKGSNYKPSSENRSRDFVNERDRYIRDDDITSQVRKEGAQRALQNAKRDFGGSVDSQGRVHNFKRVVEGEQNQAKDYGKKSAYRRYNVIDDSGSYVKGADQESWSWATDDYHRTKASKANNKVSQKTEKSLNSTLDSLKKARASGMPASEYNKAKGRAYVKAIKERSKTAKINNANAKEYAAIVHRYVSDVSKRLGNTRFYRWATH